MELVNAIDGLHSHIECAICLETLSFPKLLQCGHRFCKHCLEQLEKPYETMYCPLCKAENNEEVDYLPSDSLAANIKDELDHIKDVVQNKYCDGCPYVEATARCFDCRSSLCPGCLHRHGVLFGVENHTVVPGGTMTSWSCEKHGKDLAFMCEDCHKAVCSACLLKDCFGHQFLELETALDKYIAMTETHQEMAAFIGANSTTLEAQLHLGFEQTIQHIQEHSDKAVLSIETQSEQLIESLEKLRDDAVHIQNVTKTAYENMKDFINVDTDILRHNPPVELIRKIPDILRPEANHARDSYLMKRVMFKPNETPNIGSVSVQLLSGGNMSGLAPRLYGCQTVSARPGGKLKDPIFTLVPDGVERTIADLFAHKL